MSTNSEASSTSSDEELLHLVNLLPKPKRYRLRNNLIETFDEEEFKQRYRFSKQLVEEFVEIFQLNDLAFLTNRNYPLSPMDQLLITLRFYATGSFQMTIGDHFNINKSTVSRIIPRITEKIAAKAPMFIMMPQSENEIIRTKAAFYTMSQFPQVIGAIDCTHIKTISPGGDNAELFRNRKGWFSINTQVVCNADMKITDIVARWPGSVHDSTIFNSSALRAKFENNECPNCWLLGDSGYACKSYLLTPLLHPVTLAEQRYNNSHIHTRNVVERTFGIWKRRFPCLSQGLRINPEKAVNCIVATAVLHNIAISQRDELPIEAEIDVEDADAVAVEDADIPDRRALINAVFER